MAKVTASFVTDILDSLRDHQTSLSSTFIVLVMFTAEMLVGNLLFRCPCYAEDKATLLNPNDPELEKPKGRLYYGASYIVWPALVSFFLALGMSWEVHRCLTSMKFNCNCKKQCKALVYACSHMSTALVAPVTWFILVFMDGRFYECCISKLPSNCIPSEFPVGNTTLLATAALLRQENVQHQAMSQMIGLSILGVGVAIFTLGILLQQFCSNETFYKRQVAKLVRQMEMQTFSSVTKELIAQEMDEKWRTFFREADDVDWNSISELPSFSKPSTFHTKQFHSMFHRWQSATDKVVQNPATQIGGDESTEVGTYKLNDAQDQSRNKNVAEGCRQLNNPGIGSVDQLRHNDEPRPLRTFFKNRVDDRGNIRDTLRK